MDEQNENLQPISAEDLAKQEAAAAEVEVKEEATKDEPVDTQDETPVEETGDKDTEPVAEDAEQPEEVSDEVTEEKAEEPKEEEEQEEGEPKEEAPVEDEEQQKVDEVEELRKQVEEFEFEREEANGVAELQATVQRVQAAFADYEARVNAALRDALVDHKIDLDKSLEEIRKEDPAQYKVAVDFINQAEALKQKEIAKLSHDVQDKQNQLIFKRAEREFNKFDLTNEEAEIAADTFINIMRQVGIDNLKEDLKAKVSLAVGQGKLLAKGVKESAEKVAKVAEKVEEKAEAIQEALAPKVDTPKEEEPVAEEAPVKEEVEVTEEAPKDEAKEDALAEAKDDPVNPAVDAGAPAKVDDPDILSKLASFKLNSKEQIAFYKEHYAEINRAHRRLRTGE